MLGYVEFTVNAKKVALELTDIIRFQETDNGECDVVYMTEEGPQTVRVDQTFDQVMERINDRI